MRKINSSYQRENLHYICLTIFLPRRTSVLHDWNKIWELPEAANELFRTIDDPCLAFLFQYLLNFVNQYTWCVKSSLWSKWAKNWSVSDLYSTLYIGSCVIIKNWAMTLQKLTLPWKRRSVLTNRCPKQKPFKWNFK